MREIRRFRSYTAYAKYNLSLCTPFMHSVVANDSFSGQSGPDESAQTYLGLCYPHMPEGAFPHDAVHIGKASKAFAKYRDSLLVALMSRILKGYDNHIPNTGMIPKPA